MVKSKSKSSASAKVIYDPSSLYARGFHARASRNEWHNFMESNLSDMYRKPTSAKSTNPSDDEADIDMRKLLKDVEYFGASTWKERKQLENHKVVDLGGKPTKKHRTPLSVAKPAMKNQKKREQKKIEEEKLLGIFTKRDHKKDHKIKPEDRVLKVTEGRFKNGLLDVKHLLVPKPSRNDDGPRMKFGKGKKKGKGKKGGGGRRKGH